jgi:hypothetical protein
MEREAEALNRSKQHIDLWPESTELNAGSNQRIKSDDDISNWENKFPQW